MWACEHGLSGLLKVRRQFVKKAVPPVPRLHCDGKFVVRILERLVTWRARVLRPRQLWDYAVGLPCDDPLLWLP